MPLSALALVLVAGLCHALWNFAAKSVAAGAGPGSAVVFVWLYSALGVVILAPVVAIELATHDDRFRWAWIGAGAVSGLTHLVYSLVLQHGYAVADMNVVYPLARGTGPLITVAFALLVLHEHVGPVGVTGGVVICVGIVVIAGVRLRGTGVEWGVAVGVAIAVYTLWDNHAVTGIGVPVVLYFAVNLLVQAAAATPAVVRRRASIAPIVRRYWRQWVTVAVLSPVAYVLVLRAMTMAPVALVAPARETSIVFGALLSWLVLKEGQPGRRFIGAGVVLVGILLVAV